jgi:hypothetical protein
VPTFVGTDSAFLNLTSTVNGIGAMSYIQNSTTFAAYRTTATATQTVSYTSAGRAGVSWTGNAFTSNFNGSTASGTATAPASNFNVLQLGDYNGTHNQLGLRLSRIQYDPRPTRCR